jgi:hypothetical protein
MTQDEVIEMAKQAWVDAGDAWVAKEWFDDRVKAFEAFAKLVAAKSTEEANAKANASWTLMCKKMVAIEREACAKVCESEWGKGYRDDGSDAWLAHDNAVYACAAAIRARGEQA